MSVGGQSSNTAFFAYQRPSVVSAVLAGMQGARLAVRVAGDNLGTESREINVLVGVCTCDDVVVVEAHSTLVCWTGVS